MELKTEQPGVSSKERGAKLKELAEKIDLKNPDQFPDADIDYLAPFSRCRRELTQRITKGRNDVVVLVQLKGKLPLTQMAEGTKKAIKSALTAIAEVQM